MKGVKNYLLNLMDMGIRDFRNSEDAALGRRINFYTLMIMCFLLFVITRNIFEQNQFLTFVALLNLLVLIINHSVFRITKSVKLYSLLFGLVITLEVLITLIQGGLNGSSALAGSIFILVFMNIYGMKNGTIFVSVFFVAEILVFYLGSKVSWIFDYEARFELLRVRFIAGQIGIYVFSYYNILNQKKLLKKVVEEKENRKQLFLNIVHDMKTPLTVVKNNLNTLEEELVSTKSTSLLKSSIVKMEKDIVNILDIEKIERGFSVAISDSISNVSDLTFEICDFFSEYISSKKLDFKINVDVGIHAKIDDVSYVKVINNLIENAIKYSRENSEITVSLKAEEKKVLLTVTDTGIGIEEKTITDIFNPYYQVHQGYGSRYGLGIGLALTKEICNLYNGNISVASKVGKGSSFTVTLPAIMVNESIKSNLNRNMLSKPGGSEIPYNLKHDGALKTILIVEDNLDIRNLLIENLKGNYNLYTATNGIEALDICNKFSNINLIITDIMMPEMDGKEFVRRLKIIEPELDIPIIVLTAKSCNAEVVSCITLGAVDYIRKPFLIDELIAKVESLLAVVDNVQSNVIDSVGRSFKDFISSGKKRYRKRKYKELLQFKDYSITSKEEQVILELSKGLCYKEIAFNLNISVNTVKSHIHRIYKKCNVQSSTSLLKLFHINI